MPHKKTTTNTTKHVSNKEKTPRRHLEPSQPQPPTEMTDTTANADSSAHSTGSTSTPNSNTSHNSNDQAASATPPVTTAVNATHLDIPVGSFHQATLDASTALGQAQKQAQVDHNVHDVVVDPTQAPPLQSLGDSITLDEPRPTEAQDHTPTTADDPANVVTEASTTTVAEPVEPAAAPNSAQFPVTPPANSEARPEEERYSPSPSPTPPGSITNPDSALSPEVDTAMHTNPVSQAADQGKTPSPNNQHADTPSSQAVGIDQDPVTTPQDLTSVAEEEKKEPVPSSPLQNSTNSTIRMPPLDLTQVTGSGDDHTHGATPHDLPPPAPRLHETETTLPTPTAAEQDPTKTTKAETPAADNATAYRNTICADYLAALELKNKPLEKSGSRNDQRLHQHVKKFIQKVRSLGNSPTCTDQAFYTSSKAALTKLQTRITQYAPVSLVRKAVDQIQMLLNKIAELLQLLGRKIKMAWSKLTTTNEAEKLTKDDAFRSMPPPSRYSLFTPSFQKITTDFENCLESNTTPAKKNADAAATLPSAPAMS